MRAAADKASIVCTDASMAGISSSTLTNMSNAASTTLTGAGACNGGRNGSNGSLNRLIGPQTCEAMRLERLHGQRLTTRRPRFAHDTHQDNESAQDDAPNNRKDPCCFWWRVAVYTVVSDERVVLHSDTAQRTYLLKFQYTTIMKRKAKGLPGLHQFPDGLALAVFHSKD